MILTFDAPCRRYSLSGPGWHFLRLPWPGSCSTRGSLDPVNEGPCKARKLLYPNRRFYSDQPVLLHIFLLSLWRRGF